MYEQSYMSSASALASAEPWIVACSLLTCALMLTHHADTQVHERADVDKVQKELAASKATLANAIAEARELEHKVSVLCFSTSKCSMQLRRHVGKASL